MTPHSTVPTSHPVLPHTQDSFPQDFLRILFRRRITFALVFLAIFLGVVLYTFLATPVYEASATLHVKEEKGKEALGALGLSTSNPTGAELEILKSRTNAEQVVNRLHLNWKIEKRSAGIVFNLLDFSSTVKSPVYEVELTGPGAFIVRDDDGNEAGRGAPGQLMRGKGVVLFFADLRGKAGDRLRLELLPFNETVVRLRKEISAGEVGKNTGIIRVSCTSKLPRQASDVVNNLIQAYLEQALSFKTEEAGRAVGFVENQLQGLRGELDNSEKNLQAYKSSAGVVKLDTESEELVRKLSETEKARAEITLLKQQTEFALDALKDAVQRGGTYAPAVVRSDPLVAGMAAKLTELSVQKRSLLHEYTEAHPAVKTVQEQIEELQRKIQATFETSLKNLIKQEGTVNQQLAGYEVDLRKLPAAERDLARLTRLSKVNADIYTFLLHKREEARIAKASTINSINIVDPAIVPDRPVKPRKGMNLTLGLLFGFVLGIGIAFFQEYMDDTIKDAEEAKRVLGLPLLAIIPFISTPDDGGDEGRGGKSLITQREPKSVVAEAFRTLRTSLHFSAINRDKKTLLITSTFPGEGKTIITANLTNVFSQAGARILIIDCDLRRSSLHEKFRVAKVPGLTELLTGDVSFTDARQTTELPGVDLISAGTTPPNPSELLGSDAMRQFLLAHRDNYDHIIIDAPPVLAVTDAPVLTSLSDIVLVVVEAGRVPVKAGQHMREMLATVQAPVIGFVMNDKTRHGETYGYYGGKYHRYGYGYGAGYYADHDSQAEKKARWWSGALTKRGKKKRER